VRITGFDKGVRPLTAAETAAIARLPPVEASLIKEFGIGAAESAEGLTLSTMRPALNIRGIRAGQVGAQAASAVPAEAQVSIDFRLVPDQTPEAVRSALEAYLRGKGWTLVTATPDAAGRAGKGKLIRLEWGDGYPALRSDMESAPGKAVIATASRAAGEPVAVLPMMGASVPIELFAKVFAKPIVGLPIVAHDNNQHAANENARLQNLWDGIETYAAMMADLTW
jgi:acetylornithine deacetylase/succinyl-diaminopimelate desuccinylase-like protein